MQARTLGVLVAAASVAAATATGGPPAAVAETPTAYVAPSGGDPDPGAAAPLPATGGAKSYPFYPLAGNLGRDIFVNNYVDLDPTSGVKVYDCTSHSYDGHDAHDTSARGSFVEQEIGIPVYAALDGYVTRVHDGEPDHNTVPSGQPANFVQLYHGGGHVTGYLHLKQGSVGFQVQGQWRPWQVGDFIRAGTQIGLMASSGNSTGPHLHFSSHLASAGPPSWNGTPYEPQTGACDPGPSDWLSQVNDPTTPIVYGTTFSPDAFTGTANPPTDTAIRTGSYVAGQRTVYLRVDAAGVEVGDQYRLRLLRPDGTLAQEVADTLNFEVRGGLLWFGRTLDLNQTGTWKATLELGGVTVVQAPFEVVSSGEAPNRAPLPLDVVLEPAQPTDDDAIFCRVTSDPAITDLDYDRVTYHWVWRVGTVTVRDVVTAARADAIPHHLAQAGRPVTCTATPNDGTVDGPTAAVSATVVEGVPEPQLKVAVAGKGTVKSAAGGISCPGDCSQAYAPQSVATVTLDTTTTSTRSVVLKAAPKSRHWRFKKWTGACASFGTAKTCVLVVSGPVSVKATFVKAG